MSALNILCAQLTRDLFAIAKFLFSPLRFYLLSKIITYAFSYMLFTRIICVMKYFSSTVNFCVVGLTAHLLTACLHCYCEKNIYIEDKNI